MISQVVKTATRYLSAILVLKDSNANLIDEYSKNTVMVLYI